MRFRYLSQLTTVFLALIVMATCVTFSTVGHIAFAKSSPCSTGSTNGIVALAEAICNGQGQAINGWPGNKIVPYVSGGGHNAASPGPNTGLQSTGCLQGQTCGVDCSGFTRWVYYLAYGSDVLKNKQDVSNTTAQIPLLTRVPTSSEIPGDLVFFAYNSGKVYHVGVYTGNDQMIDAPHTGTNIRAESVSNFPFKNHIQIGYVYGYYRYIPPSSSGVLFNGYDTGGRTQLWKTNGTASSTTEVASIASGLNPGDITLFGNQALFSGVDAKGYNELWKTDGTPGGTTELTKLTNLSGGLSPSDITPIGNKAVFSGTDASGNTGLWETNGITAQELNISNAGSSGIIPGNITAFGNSALFDGYDAHGYYELWLTDGTASGTRELTTLTNNYGGLAPDDITVFGNSVLFAGYDANGYNELWITNGKPGGTLTELPGTINGTIYGVNPGEITVLGSKAVFRGVGTDSGYDLWVTDGTPTGTSELLNIPGANSSGLSSGDITLWGNKALFSGWDVHGYNELWVTDGTVSGTVEVTNLNVSASNLNPNYIAAFGTSALFVGYDTSGQRELWITDGKPGGKTTELTTAPNYVGLYFNFNYPDITVFGKQAFFDGRDAHGYYGLWVTNGTASGTVEVTNIKNGSSSGISPSDLTVL